MGGTLTVDDVSRCMAAHEPFYARHKPAYQYVMLKNLQAQWDPTHTSALDVGGGTGLMAHTIKTLFGVRRVACVDIQDRYLKSLDIETSVYDGRTLPFANGSFDCILLLNVLHHVPVASRTGLLRECRRVVGHGPIYIKDHLSGGTLDDIRLAALDLLGNTPFNGMVRASYLRAIDWSDLAATTGHVQSSKLGGAYRSGAFEQVFPNRLEISMKWHAA